MLTLKQIQTKFNKYKKSATDAQKQTLAKNYVVAYLANGVPLTRYIGIRQFEEHGFACKFSKQMLGAPVCSEPMNQDLNGFLAALEANEKTILLHNPRPAQKSE